MWGREMRAGLAFVIAALLVGGAFREWRRTHEERFADLVRELESRDGSHAEHAVIPIESSWPDSESDRAVSIRSGPRPLPPTGVPVGRIDPNRATARELERLPGIGPSLAARIIADRLSRGPFPAPEALLRVPGIGPRILERIRAYLVFPRRSQETR